MFRGSQKNQRKCPESTCSFVVLMKRNKTLRKKGLETDTQRKGVFMNEFLLLAVIMIYVAILY
jgi:hypothetical protein